jgi:hypothetical protein
MKDKKAATTNRAQSRTLFKPALATPFAMPWSDALRQRRPSPSRRATRGLGDLRLFTAPLAQTDDMPRNAHLSRVSAAALLLLPMPVCRSSVCAGIR